MAPLHFGILEIPYQLLDVCLPLDLLTSSTKDYLTSMASVSAVPADLPAHGSEITFHYIGLTMSPQTHTANYSANPTCTIDTCPRLDYLLIGGPDPTVILGLDERYLSFIRTRVPQLKTLFTTCTGGLVAARAGVLDGVAATLNHGVIPLARQLCPKVEWVADKQWVVAEGGKFWTAGGAFAGADMFAEWVVKEYGEEVARAGWMALDFVPRDVHGKHVEARS